MLAKTEGLCWHGIADVYAGADLPQRISVAATVKSSGWWELDQIFRVYPGMFCVVHGPTNHGKSTFLFNLVCNLWCQHKLKSFLFVPENEGHVVEALGRIWGDRQGWDEFNEIGYLVGSSTRRHDQSPRNLNWILSKVRECIEEGHGGLAVLDPWNEIEATRPREISQQEWIGLCLQAIAEFARDENIAVILAAHPNKAGVADGKRPGAYDLADSAHFANKAATILSIWREPGGRTAEVCCQKMREIGAGKRGGVCVFDVDEDTGRFTPQHGAVSL